MDTKKLIAISNGWWQKIKENEEGQMQLLILSVGITEKIAVGGLIYGLFHGEGLFAIILGVSIAIPSYFMAWRIRK
jgi:hypothetical protein